MTLIIADTKVTNSGSAETARYYIERALKRINLYSVRDAVPNDEISEGLFELNAMLQDWYLGNKINAFTKLTLNDSVDLNIGATNTLSFDDVIVYNLSVRFIETYDLDPRAFPLIYKRATNSLDVMLNLKREHEHDASADGFRSEFDKTLENTPDNNIVWNYPITSESS